MARDYRHGPARKAGFQRKSQQGIQASDSKNTRTPLTTKRLVLLLLGLSLAVGFGFYITNHFKQFGAKGQKLIEQPAALASHQEKQSQLASPVEPAIVATHSEPDVSVEQQVPARPSFRFYEDLPQLATVTDVEPLPLQLPEPLWIQAGSFRQLDQAQREQRRLSLEDRRMQIAPIDTENGQFYRIVIGPYSDRLALNKDSNNLRRLGADVRVVKVAPQNILD